MKAIDDMSNAKPWNALYILKIPQYLRQHDPKCHLPSHDIIMFTKISKQCIIGGYNGK
jgi:hemerythrin-like domain-containing protein